MKNTKNLMKEITKEEMNEVYLKFYKRPMDLYNGYKYNFYKINSKYYMLKTITNEQTYTFIHRIELKEWKTFNITNFNNWTDIENILNMYNDFCKNDYKQIYNLKYYGYIDDSLTEINTIEDIF
jgi:hypothetical protein